MSEVETQEDVHYVVFETPGLLDLRSLTLVGVSAKPNSQSPIGYFGTGLKLAIATLMRMNAEIAIHVGDKTWNVIRKDKDFRGTEYEELNLTRHYTSSFGFRRKDIPLPFATNYGRDWEPWMVFRELESNTRDEEGVTYLCPHDPGPSATLTVTRIVVRHPEIEKAFEERDTIFLPGHVATGRGIQVVPRPSKHLYRRGVRAYDTMKPTLLTYNFLDDLELTEDRTIKHEGVARVYLGRFIQSHDDELLIEKILTAGKEYWEHDLIFDDTVAPQCRLSSRRPAASQERPAGLPRLLHEARRASDVVYLRPGQGAPWPLGDHAQRRLRQEQRQDIRGALRLRREVGDHCREDRQAAGTSQKGRGPC